jgi:hypothetical protein
MGVVSLVGRKMKSLAGVKHFPDDIVTERSPGVFMHEVAPPTEAELDAALDAETVIPARSPVPLRPSVFASTPNLESCPEPQKLIQGGWDGT